MAMWTLEATENPYMSPSTIPIGGSFWVGGCYLRCSGSGVFDIFLEKGNVTWSLLTTTPDCPHQNA